MRMVRVFSGAASWPGQEFGRIHESVKTVDKAVNDAIEGWQAKNKCSVIDTKMETRLELQQGGSLYAVYTVTVVVTYEEVSTP